VLSRLRRAHSEIRRAPGVEIAQWSFAELVAITMPTKAGPEYRPSHMGIVSSSHALTPNRKAGHVGDISGIVLWITIRSSGERALVSMAQSALLRRRARASTDWVCRLPSARLRS